MSGWEYFQNNLFTLATMAVSFIIAGGIIAGAHRLLLGRKKNLEQARLFPRQLILLVVVLFCTIGVILVLPVSESARNQLIGLLGILLSGMIAFSSSSAMANLIAGFLLRITRPFRIGDFIRVQEHFGRVSEMGLFDTEIQSETRELIAVPNAVLVRNPVATTHSAGALISATLSLGYDLDHSRIETLLSKAAEQSGLKDPFVHIIELGNFAISYRVSGILEEVKGMITAKSRLHTAILDTLHGENIEIMSPSYMNQRRLADDQKAVPPSITIETPTAAPAAEEIIFDKAEEAERQETEKQTLQKRREDLELEAKEAVGDEKKKLKEQIQTISQNLDNLNKPDTEEP
ncbi:mechanosensitive ion channel family protein [Pontiella sp.]|uniref:mechanosensitive ion channel family protein n=1 Tax=Pontiella sp. TaxID=2837462 RepID=UPI003561E04C